MSNLVGRSLLDDKKDQEHEMYKVLHEFTVLFNNKHAEAHDALAISSELINGYKNINLLSRYFDYENEHCKALWGAITNLAGAIALAESPVEIGNIEIKYFDDLTIDIRPYKTNLRNLVLQLSPYFRVNKETLLEFKSKFDKANKWYNKDKREKKEKKDTDAI